MITKGTPKRVEKSWGYELWIDNNDEYCGKLLVFSKAGNHFSMHYHIKKLESWYVQSGSFTLKWLENDIIKEVELLQGDCLRIDRGQPHQLIAKEDQATIFEVSTQHFDEDSYRLYTEIR